MLVRARVAKLPEVQAVAAAPPQELVTIGLYNMLNWGLRVAALTMVAALLVFVLRQLPSVAAWPLLVLLGIVSILAATAVVAYTWTAVAVVAIVLATVLVTALVGRTPPAGIFEAREARPRRAGPYLYGAIALLGIPALALAGGYDNPKDYHRAIVHLEGGQCV